MCGVTGHSRIKCPRARERGGGSGSRGYKGAEVLMVEEGILGVDEVTVEEVVVVEGDKKQTLWLTGITAKNLPDRFSIFPSLHLLWSS